MNHRDERQPDGTYLCKLCGKRSPNADAFRKHKEVHRLHYFQSVAPEVFPTGEESSSHAGGLSDMLDLSGSGSGAASTVRLHMIRAYPLDQDDRLSPLVTESASASTRSEEVDEWQLLRRRVSTTVTTSVPERKDLEKEIGKEPALKFVPDEDLSLTTQGQSMSEKPSPSSKPVAAEIKRGKGKSNRSSGKGKLPIHNSETPISASSPSKLDQTSMNTQDGSNLKVLVFQTMLRCYEQSSGKTAMSFRPDDYTELKRGLPKHLASEILTGIFQLHTFLERRPRLRSGLLEFSSDRSNYMLSSDDKFDNEMDLATWCVVDAFQRRPKRERLSIFFSRLADLMQCFDVSETFGPVVACALYAGTQVSSAKAWLMIASE